VSFWTANKLRKTKKRKAELDLMIWLVIKNRRYVGKIQKYYGYILYTANISEKQDKKTEKKTEKKREKKRGKKNMNDCNTKQRQTESEGGKRGAANYTIS
jgi:hypothetical protein